MCFYLNWPCRIDFLDPPVQLVELWIGEEGCPSRSELEQLCPDLLVGTGLKDTREHRDEVLLEENRVGVGMVLDDGVQQVKLGKLLFSRNL